MTNAKLALIRKLRVPILPMPTMDKIVVLVAQSKQERRQSDALLDQARARVEQLVEAAVKS